MLRYSTALGMVIPHRHVHEYYTSRAICVYDILMLYHSSMCKYNAIRTEPFRFHLDLLYVIVSVSVCEHGRDEFEWATYNNNAHIHNKPFQILSQYRKSEGREERDVICLSYTRLSISPAPHPFQHLPFTPAAPFSLRQSI